MTANKVMEIDALGSTGDLTWQLMYNENGYYESAKGFADLVDELEDVDMDLTSVNEMDEEEILSELTREQVFAISAFGELAFKFSSLFNEDIDPNDYNDVETDDDDDDDAIGGTIASYPSD